MSETWRWRVVLFAIWGVQALAYWVMDASVWVVLGVGATLGLLYMIFDSLVRWSGADRPDKLNHS